MASSALLKLLKAGPAVARRSPGGLRVLVTSGPGAPGSSEGAADPNVDSAGPVDVVTTETRGIATAAAAREVVEEEEEDTGVDHMVENMSDKAKQTARDVWGSAKETAQKVKETVVGKAEDARDFIKEKTEDGKVMIDKKEAAVKGEAKETIKKAMNTKENC